jgi:hypothetical protein
LNDDKLTGFSFLGDQGRFDDKLLYPGRDELSIDD